MCPTIETEISYGVCCVAKHTNSKIIVAVVQYTVTYDQMQDDEMTRRYGRRRNGKVMVQWSDSDLTGCNTNTGNIHEVRDNDGNNGDNYSDNDNSNRFLRVHQHLHKALRNCTLKLLLRMGL